MDDWDSLLNLEEQAYQEGVREGTEQARDNTEVRKQGEISGYVLCVL